MATLARRQTMNATSWEESTWQELAHARKAIVFVDMVESVRIMQAHEWQAVADLQHLVRTARDEVLPRHGGALVKSTGDGMLMAFDTVPAALAAALELRRRVAPINARRDAGAQMLLRTAINCCEVAIDEIDARGHGVNVANRLMASAEPGEILLTAQANECLHPGLDVETEDLGERWLKHLVEPVRAYRVFSPVPAAPVVFPLPSAEVLSPVLAILPFAADGQAAGGLRVGELIADELICALSGLPDLQVISHLSSTAATRPGLSPAKSGGAVGADYVLSGNCHVLGGQVRVHAELFDIRRCVTLELFRSSGSLGDLLVDDSPMIADLVARVGARLLDRQVDLAQRCALPNLAGYTLLLGGIALMHRLSRQDFERARQLLEHLSERWPRLPAPHAWRARWHLFSVIQGWSADPAADRSAALACCGRALALDEHSSVALAVAGSVRIQLERDVDGGIALYERAVQCNPSDSFAWTLMGTAHAFKGEGSSATQASGQAMRLSPLDPMHFLYDCHAASAALADGDHERARALAERSMRANGQHLSTCRVLAIAQMLCGRADDARRTIGRLRALDPNYTVSTWLDRSPSAAYAIGRRFAEVLAEAGLPRS
jgi:class 3 adenylate cyclase/tetratricopeptide (TPR) repeat protein